MISWWQKLGFASNMLTRLSTYVATKVQDNVRIAKVTTGDLHINYMQVNLADKQCIHLYSCSLLATSLLPFECVSSLCFYDDKS